MMRDTVMEKGKLLIVDDEEAILEQMQWAFTDDYQVFLAPDGKTALEIVHEEKPEVVTLDLGFAAAAPGPTDGLDILQAILAHQPRTKVIVVTGSTEKEQALRAVKMGAVDFYHKPIDLEELKVIIARANHIYQLEQENFELHRRVDGDHSFERMIGSSPPMKEVFAQVRKSAVTNVAILIIGETGAGKELVARAIHQQSDRASRPFVPINCAAIPSELLESELFGHEKGSFTGAHTTREGKVELADGGTLFLDELGELSISLQVKLIRFLQDKLIERVGGRKPIQLDVRIISATNRDLQEAIEEKKFREDLFYRISVITIDIPPLRERGEDIMLLANAYLNLACSEEQMTPKVFSEAAVEALMQHPWPGNVRELENRIKRAVIMAEGRLISPNDLELEVNDVLTLSPTALGQSLKEAREELESTMLRLALKRHTGNISQAAREMGISRSSLYDLMKKYDIKP